MNSFLKLTRLFLAFVLVFSISIPAYSKKDSPDFRNEDKIRIVEANKIFNESANSIWSNWDKAPFTMIFITDDNEYLMNISNPPEDFKNIGYDSIIGSTIYTRPRQFNKNFLATFPAVNGIPTIVVGNPENTGLQSTEWIVTILHEHFHQYQYSQQDYYSSVDSLDLSGGDNTGMWMLNYKFPYEDESISGQYRKLTEAALIAYQSIGKENFNSKVINYLDEKQKFKSMLSKKDYDYFSFQIWQEGIARYTELKIADILKVNYTPSEEIRLLNDYISPDSFYVKKVERLTKNAETQSLAEYQRVCFYTLGALEGLILDSYNPNWKDLYLKEKFYNERYFVK